MKNTPTATKPAEGTQSAKFTHAQKMKLTHWKAQNTDKAKYLGTLALKNGDTFEIIETDTHLCFGGACNAGFLESGSMEKQEGESTDAALGELLEELETHYRDGSQFCNRIQCNQRM
jgi:hypothetical protein